MRLSYQTRQALGVTCIVALTVIALSVVYLAAQAHTLLAESELRGRMLANATYQRAFAIVRSRESAAAELQADPGLRAILLSAIGFAENVTYATITDVRDQALVHSSPTLEGTIVPPQEPLERLLQGGPFTQLRGVWEQRSYEVTQPLLLGDDRFGSIRIGVSTVLIWAGLKSALKPIALVAGAAIILATGVSWLMARRFLRPIHVLQSGIARLREGEEDVTLDLPDEDFKDLGTSFNALSQSVTTIRSQLVEQATSGRVGRRTTRRRRGHRRTDRGRRVRQRGHEGAAARARGGRGDGGRRPRGASVSRPRRAGALGPGLTRPAPSPICPVRLARQAASSS